MVFGLKRVMKVKRHAGKRYAAYLPDAARDDFTSGWLGAVGLRSSGILWTVGQPTFIIIYLNYSPKGRLRVQIVSKMQHVRRTVSWDEGILGAKARQC